MQIEDQWGGMLGQLVIMAFPVMQQSQGWMGVSEDDGKGEMGNGILRKRHHHGRRLRDEAPVCLGKLRPPRSACAMLASYDCEGQA